MSDAAAPPPEVQSETVDADVKMADATNVQPDVTSADTTAATSQEAKAATSEPNVKPVVDLKSIPKLLSTEQMKSAGMDVPQDDENMSSHDLTVPTVEGKTEQEVIDALERAAKQVNFYYSDSNLPTDKYFFSLTVCNSEGWVPLKTICSFKRMREFDVFGGMDFVRLALRRRIMKELDSNDPLLWMDVAGENVRRKRVLEKQTDAWDRTVYVKGFGKEDGSDTQREIEKYFDQFGYKINAVRLRREEEERQKEQNRKDDKPYRRKNDGIKRGPFKGSVFTEFGYKKDVDEFLARESYPKYQTGDDAEEMTVMTKQAYCDMKCEEKGIPLNRRHANPRQERNEQSDRPRQNRDNAKFNGFRELDNLANGHAARFAKIGDDVAVVGKPVEAGPRDGADRDQSGGRKRARDEDGEEDVKPAKREKPDFYEVEFAGQKVNVDSTTGAPVNKQDVTFVDNVVIKWANEHTTGDWKSVKVKAHEVLGGERPPFVGRPPNHEFGYLARDDNKTPYTDEEVQKLNEAQIPYGDKPIVFTRLTESEQRDFWVTRVTFVGRKHIEREEEPAQFSGRGGRQHGGNRQGGGGGRGGGRGGGGRGRGGRGRGGRGGNRGGRGGRNGGKDGESRSEGRDRSAASGLPPKIEVGGD